MIDKAIPQTKKVSTNVDVSYTFKVVNGRTEIVIQDFKVNVEELKQEIEKEIDNENGAAYLFGNLLYNILKKEMENE